MSTKNYNILGFFLLVAFFPIGCIKITRTEMQPSQPVQPSYPTMDQLDAKYMSDWNVPAYAAANSAVNETYLSDKEKKIFYYINLARLNPRLFASTYATGYKGTNGFANFDTFEADELSLIKELDTVNARRVLIPDKTLYDYAHCQGLGIANESASVNVHDRTSTGCGLGDGGEVIDFGSRDALGVVMAWLNDSGNVVISNPFGHRELCLDPNAKKAGISNQAHTIYIESQVMDFSR